jgi:hypothetical protein
VKPTKLSTLLAIATSPCRSHLLPGKKSVSLRQAVHDFLVLSGKIENAAHLRALFPA